MVNAQAKIKRGYSLAIIPFFNLLITPSALPYTLNQGNTVKTAPNNIGRGLD